MSTSTLNNDMDISNKKENDEKEENEKIKNEYTNNIQEIHFNDGDINLHEVIKSNNICSIALFGGADFYGIYNDLFLMKI